MSISKTINSLLKKLNKKEFSLDIYQEITKETVNNINKSKNANYSSLIRPRNSNNKPLDKTGKLKRSIRNGKNYISMLKYGLYLNEGTKHLKKREFIPTNRTKQLTDILNKIINGATK